MGKGSSHSTSGKSQSPSLDVGYTRDIYFWQGLKAGGWFRKGLCCMYWQGKVASSVVLALISAGALLMTQIHQYVCVCCEEHGTFTSAFPSVRAAKTQIGMLLHAGRLIWASRDLQWRQDILTPWWAALAQQAQSVTCGTNHQFRPRCVRKSRSRDVL